MTKAQKVKVDEETTDIVLPVDVPAPAEDLASSVEAVLKAVRGYSAKFNNERLLSVIDLGSRGAHQGTKFRQLYVQFTTGYINISLQEGFKSAHGGAEQRDTLFRFAVPTYKTELVKLLQDRFLNYVESSHVNEAVALVNALQGTVATPEQLL